MVKMVLILAAFGIGAMLLVTWANRHPEHLPWTRLDLAAPVGAFTGRKLAGLGDDPALCRELLGRAGIRHVALPPRSEGQCGHDDAVRLRRGGAIDIDWSPRGPAASCPVAAALALWEWHVVQPAALKHFGSRVKEIDHLGSYACRRLYGRAEGGYSEHATANAIDVEGFRLEDGTRIAVARDWSREGASSDFLRNVRDGACPLFATVLSPDYNEAHRDHLHLDQAGRGEAGWRACR